MPCTPARLAGRARFSVPIRRRHQRPRAGVPAESGRPAGRAGSDACDAQATGFNPYAPKPPHFKPRATSVISLFMSGGVSHVDTFDPKPALTNTPASRWTAKWRATSSCARAIPAR